jgi:hypothetical protein
VDRGEFLNVRGRWLVTIEARTRVADLWKPLEGILCELEAKGIERLRSDFWLKRQDEWLFDRCRSLGILSVTRFDLDGEGQVTLTMSGSGGAVDEDGASVPVWIGDFLRHHDRQDVLHKLRLSGASHCHVFVICALFGTPWPVQSFLMGPIENLPVANPDLPEPLTGVWMVCTHGSAGVRWSQEGWNLIPPDALLGFTPGP